VKLIALAVFLNVGEYVVDETQVYVERGCEKGHH
jgi:hypothetical protein